MDPSVMIVTKSPKVGGPLLIFSISLNNTLETLKWLALAATDLESGDLMISSGGSPAPAFGPKGRGLKRGSQP
jgi:hypothetical protein